MRLERNNQIIIEDLPKECIAECSMSGDVEYFVRRWVKELDFSVDIDLAREKLEDAGMSDVEKKSDEVVTLLIFHMMCCDFSEQLYWEENNPGKNPEDSDSGISVFSLD